MEAVEAVGEGGRRAQAAYGYHWVFSSLAKELFLEAFRIAINTGAKALNDLGLSWFKGCLGSHRAGSCHGWGNRSKRILRTLNSAS